MVTVAVANQKGGVGKTTTAINLGACLAERSQSVLLVDIDPQANATSSLGITAPPGRSTYQVLINGSPVSEVAVPTAHQGLWLVPASSELAGAEVEMVPLLARELRLRRALAPVIAAGQYDFILIDCPPSLGLLTVNALVAADKVLVPVQCEYLALEGVSHLLSTIELVRLNLNPNLRLAGMLLTMYDSRTRLSQQVVDEVRQHFPSTYQSIIPRSVRLSEAPSYGLTILAYDGESRAASAYRALAEEVLASARAAH